MTKPRILLVEDDVETTRMLDLYFSARGFSVETAHSGAAAVEFCQRELPAVILMDIGLPDMDGFEIYRRLRATSRARYVPIIFLTQRGHRMERLQGLGLGADDFISKPFDLEELYLRVQNVTARDTRDPVADPRTALPTGALLARELEALAGQPNRRALTVRLQNADAFRDLYGAVALADVLRHVAILLHQVLDEYESAENFVGQQSDDSFVLITAANNADAIARELVRRFDADVQQHYSQAEREGDELTVRGATGELHAVVIMQLEVGPLE